ncbi:beta-microseminoprotein [Cervus elaphus]|uniref:beta-microseminoprotein n=1 Tax=Cervus canadensis TaxID=1574408 RepID=UPI001C9E69D9|nr:beta-microseminoprotein [Cervus canadensis]XP_043332259.1 beta-microseminoprotein [Cervus canadensis]XP_043781409.1 beta-microseminoprotein [Cervus elaphus]XP_043781410.1 beta-microseminoprotein [Cervus elaphus]
MNALLGSFVVLATFVTLCNAQCYFIPNESSTSNGDLLDPETEPKSSSLAGCKDLNGVTHQLKSDWNTDNCESCHCDEAGIHCCNTAAIPTDYDRDKCQAVLNKKTCTYTVLEKKNPLKTCTVKAWVL